MSQQRLRAHRGVVAAGSGSEVSTTCRLRASCGHHGRRAVRADGCLCRTGGRTVARVGRPGATDRDSCRVVPVYCSCRAQAAARHQSGRCAALMDRFGAPVIPPLALCTRVPGRCTPRNSHGLGPNTYRHRQLHTTVLAHNARRYGHPLAGGPGLSGCPVAAFRPGIAAIAGGQPTGTTPK